MPAFLDEVSPTYYGEDRLRLTLTNPDDPLVAFSPVLISVDYARALPEDVVLPLEFTVTPPTLVNSTRMVFRHLRPGQLAFTPREGGRHLIRLAECWHNHWWGGLELDIEGDRLRAT